MAFNFNWSPLIADTSRARDMLTNALNKSPKPPIIVDDIVVTELNLGGVPPELEILEIGDLAEDRFRGIFKMTYSGDAFLTLKTRIQANPLNTYLSTRPSFASPQPLAAASGLTIPLQITLSDIRLSGFVILVFSRQKGITLVFRNDPLESLKVSSTFDSIPFVRDYLQRQIEGQIRVLFMEHLPAIIHRLSLRLFVKDYPSQANINSNQFVESAERKESDPVDPLQRSSEVPSDAQERPVEDSEISFLLDDPSGVSAAFSQKNLLRLAALTDSNRSLSLFTPTISDAVFRAWAGAAEGRDLHRPPPHQMHGGSGFTLASLSRLGSGTPSRTGSVYSASSDPGAAPASAASGSASARPSTSSHVSANTYSMSGTLTSGRTRLFGQRKRKHRVVNLRKAPAPDESAEDVASEAESKLPSRPTTPTSSSWATSSSHEREGELQTPPMSPEKKAKQALTDMKTPLARSLDPSGLPPLEPLSNEEAVHAGGEPHFVTPRPRAVNRASRAMMTGLGETPPSNSSAPAAFDLNSPSSPSPAISNLKLRAASPRLLSSPSSSSLPSYSPRRTSYTFSHEDSSSSQAAGPPSGSSGAPPPSFAYPQGGQSGGILDQVWMMKMLNDSSRKVAAERERAGSSVASVGIGPASEPGAQPTLIKREALKEHESDAPPAYVA